MKRVQTIQQNTGFVIPLRKKETGFQTAWGELEEELPQLPENARITRIDSEVKVKQGAIGRGYVKVDKITTSSSGSTRYLWVNLKRFESERYEKAKKGSGTNYKSHVERSHTDTATPRANQYGTPYAPSRRKR